MSILGTKTQLTNNSYQDLVHRELKGGKDGQSARAELDRIFKDYKCEDVNTNTAYTIALTYLDYKAYSHAWKWLFVASALNTKNPQSEKNANLLVGFFFLFGTDYLIAADYNDAKTYFETAAKQESLLGLAMLHFCYTYGYGTAKDSHAAEAYLTQFCELLKKENPPESVHDYSNSFEATGQVRDDYKKHLAFIKKTIATVKQELKNKSSPTIDFLPSKLLSESKTDKPKDTSKETPHTGSEIKETEELSPLEQLKHKAKAGDATAQFTLGNIFLTGEECCFGVSKDLKQAFEYFQQASEHGHRDAMFIIAKWSYAGYGTKQNFKTAKSWLNKLLGQLKPGQDNFYEAKFLLAIIQKFGLDGSKKNEGAYQQTLTELFKKQHKLSETALSIPDSSTKVHFEHLQEMLTEYNEKFYTPPTLGKEEKTTKPLGQALPRESSLEAKEFIQGAIKAITELRLISLSSLQGEPPHTGASVQHTVSYRSLCFDTYRKSIVLLLEGNYHHAAMSFSVAINLTDSRHELLEPSAHYGIKFFSQFCLGFIALVTGDFEAAKGQFQNAKNVLQEMNKQEASANENIKSSINVLCGLMDSALKLNQHSLSSNPDDVKPYFHVLTWERHPIMRKYKHPITILHNEVEYVNPMARRNSM